jgi:glycopeptide antibiotics resistance protein
MTVLLATHFEHHARYIEHRLYVSLLLFLLAVSAIVCSENARIFVHTEVRRRRLASIASEVGLAASLATIITVTLFPTHGDHKLQLVPLGDIVVALTPPMDWSRLLESVFNILLFIPLGGALRTRGLSVRKTVLIASAISTSVELLQLFVVAGRTTSVDDVMLNAVGAAAGYELLPLVRMTRWTIQSD